ncbi:MAG TPA: carboxylesterase/lipase family protein [Acidimicrobiales bacterium]|nr:carboxylesterase/lipase family protein [Acidimicrobiales bacterium]
MPIVTLHGVIVDTLNGKVQGIERRGVHQFRGIPYARAERFGPPEPVDPWSGVRDATSFGPSAPQNQSATEALLGGGERVTSEDCLSLNVFTPAPDERARPVMVWIHGGGFTGGSGDVVWYDGSALARANDVVVVTINYRLGVLGFLHLDHLDGAFAGSGANGIRDQVAALRWVADNIGGFGGDPADVTVFGESAGGMSVTTLLATPSARGLFRRAAAQSGAGAHTHPAGVAERVTDAVLDALHLSPGDVDGLRAAPVEDLLAAQAAVEAPRNPQVRGDGGVPVGALVFQPVVDGTVLPEAPLPAIRSGSATGVPLLLGTTADEWNLFHLPSRLAGPLDEDKLRRRIGRIVPDDRVEDVLDAYRGALPGADPDALLCAAMTDMVFAHPAAQLAAAQVETGTPVHAYRFDLPSAAMGGLLGACHTVDIPFVFDNLDRGGVETLLGGLDDEVRRLATLTSRAWAAFARTGSPSPAGPTWPAYDLLRRSTCVLDRTPGVEDDPRADRRLLWEELRPHATA